MRQTRSMLLGCDRREDRIVELCGASVDLRDSRCRNLVRATDVAGSSVSSLRLNTGRGVQGERRKGRDRGVGLIVVRRCAFDSIEHWRAVRRGGWRATRREERGQEADELGVKSIALLALARDAATGEWLRVVDVDTRNLLLVEEARDFGVDCVVLADVRRAARGRLARMNPRTTDRRIEHDEHLLVFALDLLRRCSGHARGRARLTARACAQTSSPTASAIAVRVAEAIRVALVAPALAPLVWRRRVRCARWVDGTRISERNRVEIEPGEGVNLQTLRVQLRWGDLENGGRTPLPGDEGMYATASTGANEPEPGMRADCAIGLVRLEGAADDDEDETGCDVGETALGSAA